MHRLLVTANVVPRSLILVILIMEALSSSETSVLTRATQRNIPEDATVHKWLGLPMSSQSLDSKVCLYFGTICCTLWRHYIVTCAATSLIKSDYNNSNIRTGTEHSVRKIPQDSQGLLFRGVVRSKNDVGSGVFETDNIRNVSDFVQNNYNINSVFYKIIQYLIECLLLCKFRLPSINFQYWLRHSMPKYLQPWI
jgi:hypothetical protein